MSDWKICNSNEYLPVVVTFEEYLKFDIYPFTSQAMT